MLCEPPAPRRDHSSLPAHPTRAPRSARRALGQTSAPRRPETWTPRVFDGEPTADGGPTAVRQHDPTRPGSWMGTAAAALGALWPERCDAVGPGTPASTPWDSEVKSREAVPVTCPRWTDPDRRQAVPRASRLARLRRSWDTPTRPETRCSGTSDISSLFLESYSTGVAAVAGAAVTEASSPC